MNLFTFTEKIKRGLEDFFEDQVTVEAHQIPKNNGILLYGISLKEKESNLAPTIYMESFYEEYQKGKSLGKILYEIVNLYERHKKERDMDMEFFRDYERVKARLAWKFVHYERNKEMLAHMPHFAYLDLAMVFYCMMFHEELGNISIMVQKEHCDLWGIDEGQLQKDAMANAQRILPAECISMRKLLLEAETASLKEQMLSVIGESMPEAEEEWAESMAEEAVKKMQEEAEKEEDEGMYVLTNCQRMYGAAAMLYPGELEKFAEQKKCSFFILPSSVHEVILLPDRGEKDRKFLQEMVQEINESFVEKEEVLSDSVYYYDRDKKELLFLFQDGKNAG